MLHRNGGIYIALGANLPSRFGTPRETLEAVLDLFASQDITVLRRSSWSVSYTHLRAHET